VPSIERQSGCSIEQLIHLTSVII